MNVNENDKNPSEQNYAHVRLSNEIHSQKTRVDKMRFSSEQASMVSTAVGLDPSNDGLSNVKRLFDQRRMRAQEREQRIRQNRGIGSTKTTYSMGYRDFNTQSVQNMSDVFGGRDRSKSIR